MECCQEAINKAGFRYYRLENSQYHPAFSSLIQTLLDNNYTPEEIQSNSLLAKVCSTITPDNYETKKLKKWREIIEQVWKHECGITFKEYNTVKVSKARELSVLEPIPSFVKPAPEAAPERERIVLHGKGIPMMERVKGEDLDKLLDEASDE